MSDRISIHRSLVLAVLLTAISLAGCGGNGTTTADKLTGRWVTHLADPPGAVMWLDLERSGENLTGWATLIDAEDEIHTAVVLGGADNSGVDLRYSFLRAGDTSFMAAGEFVGALSGEMLDGIAIDEDTEGVTTASFQRASPSSLAKGRADEPVGGWVIAGNMGGSRVTLTLGNARRDSGTGRYIGTFTVTPALYKNAPSGEYELSVDTDNGKTWWTFHFGPPGEAMNGALYYGIVNVAGTKESMLAHFGAQSTNPRVYQSARLKAMNGEREKVTGITIARP